MNKKLLATLSSFALVVLFGVGIYNHQFLKDQFILRTTSLEADSASIMASISLTDEGEYLYRVSQTQLQDQAEYNRSCAGAHAGNAGIVLGCYTGSQRIFLYNVKDKRLSGVKEVTAAHELLHAAYDRMTRSERAKVDALLRAERKKINDQRVLETIKSYEQEDAGQVINELHSIIGTELKTISKELEKHYQKYFKNRQQIVKYSEQYESVFVELEEQRKTYDQRLLQLKSQIDQLEQSLQAQQAQIDASEQNLQKLRSSGDTEGYNAAVPGHNALIRSYRAHAEQVKALISEYNQIVAKRNQLATTQNELVKQLDSNYK